jgi:hypothetical protein
MVNSLLVIIIYRECWFTDSKFIWVWWHTPVMPALRRLKQEDHDFQASLGCIERPCVKTINK